MAKRKPLSGREVADIGAQIDQVAKGSEGLQKRLQSVLMSGKKMSRGLENEFKKVQRELISGAKDQEAQLSRLQRMQARGENISSKRISSLEQEIRRSREQVGVLDKVTASTQKQGSSLSELISRMVSMTSVSKILTGVVDILKKAFENWLDLSRKWTSAMGNIAQQTGATAAQMRGMESGVRQAAAQFGRLTGEVDGLAPGGQFFGEMAIAMRNVNDMTPEVQHQLLQVSRGFGAGTEGAVQLMRTINAIEPNSNLTDFGADMIRFASSIGAQAAVLTRDFIEARGSVAQFGDQGVETFQRASLMANKFGFETRKIFDMMKGFDTFDSASQNVNTLNTMLGTSLSSFELMVEQDPSRRLEMVRRAIGDQGLEWNNMSRQQRMAVAQTLNLQEDEAARIFSNNMTLEDMEAERARAAEQQINDAELARDNQVLMNQLLSRTAEVFEDIGRAVQRLWNSFSTLLAPIFQVVNNGLRGIVDRITEWVNSARGQETINRIIQATAGFIQDVFNWIQEVMPTWEELEVMGANAWITITEWAEKAWEIMKVVYETIKDDVIPWFQETWAEIEAGNHPINDLADTLKTVWDITKGIFETFKSGFDNIVMPQVRTATAAFGGFSNALGSVASAIGLGGEGEEQAATSRGRFIGGLNTLPDTAEMSNHQKQDSFYGIVRTLRGRGTRISDIASDPELSQRFADAAPEGTSYRNWVTKIYSGAEDPHGRERAARVASIVGPRAAPWAPPTPVVNTTEETSATTTSPRTSRTQQEPVSRTSVNNGGNRVEIVASDIYLNGREVGRALFEISQGN